MHKIDVIETISELWNQGRKHKFPLAIFIALCLNVFIAPIVYASAGATIDRSAAWSLGVLGFVTLGLIFYLFVVIFQPERF